MNNRSIFTKVVHAGKNLTQNHGAISPPVYNSAVYAFPDVDQATAINEGLVEGYSYGRKGNPTQAVLEAALCELEVAEAALAFASGMAAISATLMTLLQPGDHLVASDSLYAGTQSLLDEILIPLGIKVTHVDPSKPQNYIDAAHENTKVFYIETPANPTLKLTDISAVTQSAHERNIAVVTDNTFATPINQRPVEFGADIVIHSASKYLGGHGDLVAGVVLGAGDFIHRLRWHTSKLLGGVIAPQTAWLVLRGLRTLAIRIERQNANAFEIARYLDGHSKVVEVHYPGLASHPQHDLAGRQMDGFGGMIAFEVDGLDRGKRLANNVRLCTLAVSLGNVETLIQHSASMTHASVPADKRRAIGISDGLIRLSVGIEDAGDIIADLEQALSNI